MEHAHITQPIQVHLIEFPPARVAYLRRIGAYGPATGKFLHEVFVPWLQANGLQGRPWYGLPHDDPTITAADKCRFDACVEVPEGFVARGQASLTTLPGGRYAAGAFTGTSLTIVDAWTEMFRDWLPNSGMRCDTRPFFDYISADSHFDPDSGVFDCQLCIPVCPL